jgi:hypothetical protein
MLDTYKADPSTFYIRIRHLTKVPYSFITESYSISVERGAVMYIGRRYAESDRDQNHQQPDKIYDKRFPLHRYYPGEKGRGRRGDLFRWRTVATGGRRVDSSGTFNITILRDV